MSFLPKGYELPISSGNYLKLEKGDTTFRILTNALTGYEYWTNENKPVRSHDVPESTPNIKIEKDGSISDIKHFWAMAVWNYAEEKVQILQITQSTVLRALNSYIEEPSLGNPKNYDIKISRTGDGLKTKYSTMALPPKPLEEEVQKIVKETKLDLLALLNGNDPFQTTKLLEENDAEITKLDEIAF